MRLHIGQIAPALAADIGDLESRLERYGKILSNIDLRRKEHGDWYFGFIDVDLSDSQFQKLRNALGGVMFKRSRLKIDKARNQPLPPIERPAKPIWNLDQIKRLMSHKALMNGRLRASDRKSINTATYRVIIRGKVHKPAPRKQKLWGVERRPIQKLAFDFQDGRWVNAEGQTVEVVAHTEQERNAKLLEDIPAGYLSDSDFDEFQSSKQALAAEDESDSDLEVVPKLTVSQEGAINAEPIDPVADDEHDYTPTDTHREFTNQTEALRDAFQPESKPFTLFYDAESLPEAAEMTEPEPIIEQPQQQNLGLFWIHESPLLRLQSQSVKLNGEFDPEAWHVRFYENRGDYNRYLKRRRRDILKKQRKMRTR